LKISDSLGMSWNILSYLRRSWNILKCLDRHRRTKVMTPPRISGSEQYRWSWDVLRDRDTPEISACNTT
jgi:hypothetical protein